MIDPNLNQDDDSVGTDQFGCTIGHSRENDSGTILAPHLSTYDTTGNMPPSPHRRTEVIL
jgi:hypothetical protein